MARAILDRVRFLRKQTKPNRPSLLTKSGNPEGIGVTTADHVPGKPTLAALINVVGPRLLVESPALLVRIVTHPGEQLPSCNEMLHPMIAPTSDV